MDTRNNLELENAFINFMFTGSVKQCKYLLRNITESQSKVLCEIALNLLNLELSKKLKKQVNKHSALLKRLIKPQVSLKQKVKLVKLNSSKLYSCLIAAKDIILEALKKQEK